jgi:hypothetical protein
MKTIVNILLLISLLCGVGAAQHPSSPTNHNPDFNAIADDFCIISSHQHPFYFDNETITKTRIRPNNVIANHSCSSFDPLSGIEVHNVWMTNLTTFNRTAEAYIFSPEDFRIYTHFSCYVFEEPPDASIVWIDPDGDAYHTTTFHDIEDGYQHWRSGINVKGHYPEDNRGEWQAYVYINGELIAIKRFWIGTPTPSGSNLPPVAEIGGNQTIHIGDTFAIDGHRSYDPDGNIMSYDWSRKRSYWSGWRNWSIIRDVWYTTGWSPVFEPFFYDFVLTVTDDGGAIDTARKQVTIEPTEWDLADADSDGIPNVLDRNPDEPDAHVSWDVGKYAVYDVIEDDLTVGSFKITIMPPVLINGYTFYVSNCAGYYDYIDYFTPDGWFYKEIAANHTYITAAADREGVLWNHTVTGPVSVTTPAGTFECYVVDKKEYRDGHIVYHSIEWEPIPWDRVRWEIKIVSYNVSTGAPIRTRILTDYSGRPVQGDLNNDAQITTTDAAIALELAAGSRPCDAAMLTVADVNNDGQVTSLDALMILQAAVGNIDLHSPQPAPEIEIAYDDGSAEGRWSRGSSDGSCSDDCGNRGYAIRMTTPDSEPFTITAIKLFSRRYGEDCNTRFEIWDRDRNTLYSDVVSHSEYSAAVDSWDSAKWGCKGVPNIVVCGDFYIAMYTDSTDPDDDVYPDTGVYVGYDTSFSSDRSHTVQEKTLGWGLSTPQETTNWMIRAVGTK